MLLHAPQALAHRPLTSLAALARVDVVLRRRVEVYHHARVVDVRLRQLADDVIGGDWW